MNYEHAIVKFEGPVATLLCNGCGIMISEGTKHEDRLHFCTMCMSGNCKAKFKNDTLVKSKSKQSDARSCQTKSA